MREQDRERQKREWENKERQAEEFRTRDVEETRQRQEGMQMRMQKQDEEMRRRQQENTLFMQAQQLSNMLDQQEMGHGNQGGGGGGSGMGNGGGGGRKNFNDNNDNRRNFDQMNQGKLMDNALRFRAYNILTFSGNHGGGGGGNQFQQQQHQGNQVGTFVSNLSHSKRCRTLDIKMMKSRKAFGVLRGSRSVCNRSKPSRRLKISQTEQWVTSNERAVFVKKVLSSRNPLSFILVSPNPSNLCNKEP